MLKWLSYTTLMTANNPLPSNSIESLIFDTNDWAVWLVELDRHWRLRRANRQAYELIAPGGTVLRGSTVLALVNPDEQQMVEDLSKSLLEFETPRRPLSFAFGNAAQGLRPVLAFMEKAPYGLRLYGIDLRSFVDALVSPDTAFFNEHAFSPRERTVLELMMHGLSIQEMASELNVAVNTVKTYMHSVYLKVGVQSRRELFEVMRQYHGGQAGYGSFLGALVKSLLNTRL